MKLLVIGYEKGIEGVPKQTKAIIETKEVSDCILILQMLLRTKFQYHEQIMITQE